MQKEKRFYTVAQLVEFFGKDVISKSSIHQRIKKGEIPTKVIGQKHLIPASWVNDFLKEE